MMCPICGRDTVQSTRPFCSKRCADLDLAKWLNGSYAVPSDDEAGLDLAEEALKQERGHSDSRKPH